MTRLFILGLMLCACRAPQPRERMPVLPTPTPSPRPDTPTPTIQPATPSPAFTPTPEVRITPTAETRGDQLRITIVYDNDPYDPQLKTAWGFSALIEYRAHTLLFDTGGDGNILAENMQVLGIEPATIQSIVLSHIHGDHTGGLSVLLSGDHRPPVYLLPSFSNDYKRQLEHLTQVKEVNPGLVIADGLLTTGEVSGNIPEQALIIRTGKGLVVVTGCAHPGIVPIIERARELTGDPVYLVLGGFHLGEYSPSAISSILTDFRRLGVQQVAPCHCTGERAIAMFAAEYGQSFIQIGVGAVITFAGSE